MDVEVHQKGWMHVGWFWRWVMVFLQPCGPLRVSWHCPSLQLMVPEVLGVQLEMQ